MRIELRSLGIAMALAMSGCGGGGDDAPSTSRPVGLWNGTSSTFDSSGTQITRKATALTLSDGTYWVLYSTAGDPNLLAGMVQGHSSSSNMSFSSNDARDFNFEGLGVSFGSVNGSYVPKTSLQGVFAYSSGNKQFFQGTYDASNERSPSLAEIAGAYSGQVALSSGTQSGNVTVTSDGAVSGSANGCAVSGSVTPRVDAYAYDVSLRFGAAPCIFAGQAFVGIAVFDPATNQLIVGSPDAGRSDGLLFVGSK